MKYFTLELKTARLNHSVTVYCYEAQAKLGNDIISGRGNTEWQAIEELVEALRFERS